MTVALWPLYLPKSTIRLKIDDWRKIGNMSKYLTERCTSTTNHNHGNLLNFIMMTLVNFLRVQRVLYNIMCQNLCSQLQYSNHSRVIVHIKLAYSLTLPSIFNLFIISVLNLIGRLAWGISRWWSGNYLQVWYSNTVSELIWVLKRAFI